MIHAKLPRLSQFLVPNFCHWRSTERTMLVLCYPFIETTVMKDVVTIRRPGDRFAFLECVEANSTAYSAMSIQV